MDCIIFVTVRTASTRLPKKALLKIENKPLIKLLIDHISESKNIQKIVVCTTNEKSDDKLVEYLQNNNVEVFRGDSIDILNRLYTAAKKYKAEQFVVVEGDDVFCDPFLIEETCKKLSQNGHEFLYWEDLPFGVSPIGIKTEKLCILMKSKKIKNTETGWGKLIIESGLFKIGKLKPASKKLIRPEIRLSIDYKEDFYLAKKIYENLPSKFSLIDVIKLLNKNPKWLKINESVKKIYDENFERRRAKTIIKKKGIKK